MYEVDGGVIASTVHEEIVVGEGVLHVIAASDAIAWRFIPLHTKPTQKTWQRDQILYLHEQWSKPLMYCHGSNKILDVYALDVYAQYIKYCTWGGIKFIFGK